ncbi:restriction endonuclease subunit S [Paenibacillus sp. OK003]|uniref:restriction endonuclease subunit S n=1 Tax=Paenibacillus sp. OK003 TaxID=1884380 RepID=UPI0008CDCB12|nr:restriction endonuclease subunit S [Paenibacillus sp. OK003]SEK83032.1 type I restriction enzyme, S subunit [Paenibacillus sp. OK003]
MKNNRRPEIRFPGYTGDWDQCKIGDFLTESKLPGTNGLSARKLTVKLWGKGVVPKDEIYQGSEATKYYTRKARQFIYGKLDFLHQAFGIIPDKLDGYESTLDSPAFDIANNLNSSFFLEYVSRREFYLYQGTIANGSRKAKRIHSETFFEMPLIVPTMDEQSDIGYLFKNLDDAVTLQQQELTALKQTKQGFLQKMFPKEGEIIPEVRFPGFSGNWKQQKLESIYGKIRNAFVGTATPYYVEDGHFYLESNNVKDGQINKNTEVFINDEFYEKQKDNWLHTGDLVMVQSGHVGHTAVIPEELDNTAAHALIMFSNYLEKTDPHFLNYQFQTHNSKKKLGNITTGNTVKHILASEMKVFLVDIPTYEEQLAIGNFFKLIDNTIALYQRELEDLKEIKRAFIQKMFV